MIDQVYTTLQTIVNKENSGYVSPGEFNQIAKQVQDKIFRGYFEDGNRDKNRENRGLTNEGTSNLFLNQSQRFSPFYTSATIAQAGGVYPLPTGVYYIQENGVTNSSGKVVDRVEHNKDTYVSLTKFGPSDTYPTYTRKGGDITVSPSTYTDNITVSYIRHPKDPKWTYTVVSGQELYDPSKSDFQDFELQEVEFPTIVIEMLSYFGINLREGEVVQVAEALKNKEQVKENS